MNFNSDFLKKIDDTIDEINGPYVQTFQEKMLSSFAIEIIETKQFDRYVEKIKNQIFDYINSQYSVNEKNGKNYTLNWFKARVVAAFIPNEMCDSDIKIPINNRIKGNLFYIIDHNVGNILECFYNEEENIVEEKYIKKIYDELKDLIYDDPIKDHSFELIFNQCLKSAAIRMLGYISAENTNISKENYIFQTLPLKESDLCHLIYETIRSMYWRYALFIRAVYEEDMIARKINRKVGSRDDKISDLKAEISMLKKVNKEQATALAKAQHYFSQQDAEKDERYNLLYQTNQELVRKQAKSKRRYDDLLEKYNNLQKQVSSAKPITNDTDFKEKNELVPLDMNGKYVFTVLECFTTLSANIVKMFPNAVVTDGSNLPDNADMFVVLSEATSHTYYKKIKNHCKAKNIPLIHCTYKNLDMVKELMEQHMNKL